MAEEFRYCVVCRRTYGPTMAGCCTPNSLVRLVREGWLRKRETYYGSDGRVLGKADLEELQSREAPAAAVRPSELREQPIATSQEWVLRFVRFYRSLGFFTGTEHVDEDHPFGRGAWPGCERPLDFARFSDEELADLLIARYERDHDCAVDAVWAFDDADLLRYDTSRVWSEDMEADVCAGNDVYVWVLREWARISRGCFRPEDITETWETDEGPITVTFAIDGVRCTWHPAFDGDWIDPHLLEWVNEVIAPTGCEFECLSGEGQDILVFALSAEGSERYSHRP
jgi:hypothetical protein